MSGEGGLDLRLTPRLALRQEIDYLALRFMDTNFGIGFYFFGRFFHTVAKRHRFFNRAAYHCTRSVNSREGTAELVGEGPADQRHG